MVMSAVEKNIAGGQLGSLGWAAVIIRVDRGCDKEVTLSQDLKMIRGKASGEQDR